MSCLTLSARDSVFVINKSLRCKPASKFLIKTASQNDTFVYKLILQNQQAVSQQLLLEIPIQQIDRIIVQQFDSNALQKNYLFTTQKLSQRIYYDRNIIFSC
jgi:hypothetical protein